MANPALCSSLHRVALCLFNTYSSRSRIPCSAVRFTNLAGTSDPGIQRPRRLELGAFRRPHLGAVLVPFHYRILTVCIALLAIAPASGSSKLVLARGGVGLAGTPASIGSIDANGNGRPEFVVAGRSHFSVVEEDTSLRGYREIARVDGPDLSLYHGVRLVDVAGSEPALLVNWGSQLELRDAASYAVRAVLTNRQLGRTSNFGAAMLADVDGDGRAEIVANLGNRIWLLDPLTFDSLGELAADFEVQAAADLVGDGRAELISGDGRAYTVSRNGDDLSAAQAWDAGLAGDWRPKVFNIDGHAALFLHEPFGFEARIATFRPTMELRTFTLEDGASFPPVFADADDDGRTDLIVLSGNRTIRAFDITSGLLLWERDTLHQEPALGMLGGLAAVDLDADGRMELLSSADAASGQGLIAMSIPPEGEARWRTEYAQTKVVDWTLARNTGGAATLAYLTEATFAYPRLGTLGFLDAATLADQGGSALAWLPGYTGLGEPVQQRALDAISRDDLGDEVVVVGAEYPLSGGAPLERWLWTFSRDGQLQSSRTLDLSVDPQQIKAAQVLDRPETQLVIAGWGALPSVSQPLRVEIADYATGSVIWQSDTLWTSPGAPISKLRVADLDGDGHQEVLLAFGQKVAVFKPSSGAQPVREYSAAQFALLARGEGRSAILATLIGTTVEFHEGLSSTPKKRFELPGLAHDIALFRRPHDRAPMFATRDVSGITVRRLADGAVVASSQGTSGYSLAAMDLGGDGQVELIAWDSGSGDGFKVWHFSDPGLFGDSFEVPP